MNKKRKSNDKIEKRINVMGREIYLDKDVKYIDFTSEPLTAKISDVSFDENYMKLVYHFTAVNGEKLVLIEHVPLSPETPVLEGWVEENYTIHGKAFPIQSFVGNFLNEEDIFSIKKDDIDDVLINRKEDFIKHIIKRKYNIYRCFALTKEEYADIQRMSAISHFTNQTKKVQ